MKQNKTLIVIPYLDEGAQGGELETAVEGWNRFFTQEKEIVIIGSWCPVTEYLMNNGRVSSVIMMDRKPEHRSEPALDACRKIRYIITRYSDEYDGCVWTNDDIYPVNPISMEDIEALKGVGGKLKGDINSDNYFQRAMWRTREELIIAGRPTDNYSSHCPKWYDFRLLAEVIDIYNCKTVPLLIESLYFNHHFGWKDDIINVNAPDNRIKCGLYTKDYDLSYVAGRIRDGVLFVNNSPVGYRPELISLIREHIFNKSL